MKRNKEEVRCAKFVVYVYCMKPDEAKYKQLRHFVLHQPGRVIVHNEKNTKTQDLAFTDYGEMLSIIQNTVKKRNAKRIPTVLQRRKKLKEKKAIVRKAKK